MSEQPKTPGVRPPESNAQTVASRLVYQTVDLDGTSLIHTLSLLLSRAAQLKAHNLRLLALDEKVKKKEVTTQEEYNAELLEGLYETTCLKWFLAAALKELARRLESEALGAQIRCAPIRKITFTPDGDVESFLLESDDRTKG